MKSAPKCRRLHSWLLTLGLMNALAIGVTVARAEEDEPLDARILEELNDFTMIDFKNVDLKHAVEYLDDFHRGVKFEIDHKAFTEANIDLNKRLLTYKSPLRSPLYVALWEMLGKRDLSFMVKDHKIVFTTTKAAEEWQKKFRNHVATKK